MSNIEYGLFLDTDRFDTMKCMIEMDFMMVI